MIGLHSVSELALYVQVHISMTFVLTKSGSHKSHYRGVKLVAGGLWSIEVHVRLTLKISDILASSNPSAILFQLTDLPLQ